MCTAGLNVFNWGWGGGQVEGCAERNWDQNAFSSKTAVIFCKQAVTDKRNSFK